MLIIDPVPAVDIPALDLVDLAAKLVAAFFELLIQRQWFACRGFRRAGCQQCQCGHTQQGSHGFPTSGVPGCLARAMISVRIARSFSFTVRSPSGPRRIIVFYTKTSDQLRTEGC